MNDLIVTTFPMKPLSKIKVGTFTAPLYVSFLGEKLQCKSILSLNILNSYKKIEDNSIEYSNILENIGIRFDDVFIDYKNIDSLIKNIEILDTKKLLIEKEEKILNCECNKIDIVYSTINNIYNYDLIEFKNNKCFCKSCGKECVISTQKRLFLKIDERYVNNIQTIPRIYDENLYTIGETLKNSYFLISKNRETGIIYKGYNIDIDFVWNNYVNTFNENNIIIVTSNKHLMKVFITNYLANIFNKNVIYILHPFIEKKNEIIWSEKLYKFDEYYKKLFLLYSPKWNTRFCYYDEGLFKSLAKLRIGGRLNLYNDLRKNDTYDNLFNYLESFICKDINFQKNYSKLKLKKILISDYDNTFHIYYDDLLNKGINFSHDKEYYDEKSINNKIEKFRKKNLFCINTGRSYNSIKNVSPHIKYDFLICNNGAEIYDKDDFLINYNSLNINDIEIINNYNFNETCKIKKYCPNGIDDIKKITAVSIRCEDIKIFEEMVSYFTNTLIETNCFYQYPRIRLVNRNIDKSHAIEYLINKNYISKDLIYTIGDDDNDLPMLKNYHSSTMKWCTKNVRSLNLTEYDNIIDYINDIEVNYEK